MIGPIISSDKSAIDSASQAIGWGYFVGSSLPSVWSGLGLFGKPAIHQWPCSLRCLSGFFWRLYHLFILRL